jgi:hypothetical protein
LQRYAAGYVETRVRFPSPAPIKSFYLGQDNGRVGKPPLTQTWQRNQIMNYSFHSNVPLWHKPIGLKLFYRLGVILLAGLLMSALNGRAQTVNSLLNCKPTGAYVGSFTTSDNDTLNFTLYVVAANNGAATALFVYTENGLTTRAFTLNTDQGHYNHVLHSLTLIPVEWESDPDDQMRTLEDIGFNFDNNPVTISGNAIGQATHKYDQFSGKKDAALSADLQKQLDSGATVLKLSGCTITLGPAFLAALHAASTPMPSENNISGVYWGMLDSAGDYCKLSLVVGDDGTASALFAYTDYVFKDTSDPMADPEDLKNAKVIAAYSLKGNYDATANKLELNAGSWVLAAPNTTYQMNSLSFENRPQTEELMLLRSGEGSLEAMKDETLTAQLWQQTDKSPAGMLRNLGVVAAQAPSTFADSMFSERENKLMDASGKIIVPANYDAPTTEEVRLGFLRSMAQSSPDGHLIDSHSVRYSTVGAAIFKSYAIMRIDSLDFTSAPVADASGGYDCSYTMHANISQSFMGGEIRPVMSGPLSGTSRFVLGPDGWWSPDAAQRVLAKQLNQPAPQ